MVRHYSARSFFRQIPIDLLARYSESRGLRSELDFAAWLELPDERREALESEFREIFEMGSEKGVWAILDEARYRWGGNSEELTAFVKNLSSQPSHFHRAIATCLDHRECWTGATRVRHAELLPDWHKLKHLGHRPAATDTASLNQLADLIGTYFQRSEARGCHCLVETSKKGELDCFFAYPEDYSRQEIEWIDGKLGLRQHHPALEVVFVYSRKEGSLDVNFSGPYRALRPLQEMFATAILKLDRFPDPGGGWVYDLDPLLQRDFEFVCGRDTSIEAVAVRRLRLSLRARKGDRITLEADDSIHPDAVYDVLELVGRCTPLHLFNITQAELVALVAQDREKPARRVPIRLTTPASCSLGYGERDLKLRSMLKSSGIEPASVRGDRDLSPEGVLFDLGARVGTSKGRSVRVDSREMAGWPGEAVSALKSQKLLRKALPARSTVCDGCGRQCAMPVDRGLGPSMPWVVCDKRNDINRVPVSKDRLAQWRTSDDILGRFFAGGLSLRWRGRKVEDKGAMEIVMATGGKHSRKLNLRIEGELAFVARTGVLALSKVVFFREGGYKLDGTLFRRWADATAANEPPVTSSHIRREARKLDTRKKYKDWQKAYRVLKREKPGKTDVWYSRQIAKSDLGGGHRPDTIRKNMKK